MKKLCYLFGALLIVACQPKNPSEEASTTGNKPEVTVAVVSDLHFDMPPETDQFHHVVAINRLNDSIHIDAVLQTGDLFDKADTQILALYRERWEQNKDSSPRNIHCPVYPLYGNHDIAPEHGRPNINKQGYELNMQYLDSLLKGQQIDRTICDYDPDSRAYSFNLGGVHFVMVSLAAGDTTYCKSNFEWLRQDLKTHCSDGTPLVYCQHYGFDEWALEWWTDEQRQELMKTLQPYRLAAFFVGHTHQWSVQQFFGIPIVQVNNAWRDSDGPASFCLLKIKGDDVSIETYAVLDEGQTVSRLEPVIKMEMRN